VLDLGCGVGRLSALMACHYPDARVIGVDSSAQMIEKAKAVVCGEGEPVQVDLSRYGFGQLALPRLACQNVEFACEAMDEFASRWLAQDAQPLFDIVVMANVLDRLADAAAGLSHVYSLVAPGGLVVGSSPLNFRSEAEWNSIASVGQLTRHFEDAGFIVDFLVDDFVYREVLDARGAVADYPTCMFRLTRPSH
jgi:trans-aconitate methyltransferase